jgi:hypothetical protein
MTFNPREGLGDIAAVSVVRSDYIPELTLTLDGPANAGQLIVNMRAEGDPEDLHRALLAAVAAVNGGLTARLDHCERFRPGRPTPTHRVTNEELARTSAPQPGLSKPAPAVLYCHCQYAQVVPAEVKQSVLRQLCAANIPFEAVPDLCELSARRDPALQRLAATGAVKIAACYPRAVKWLFAAANAPLPAEATEVLNMRTQPADEVAAALLAPELTPNLPQGKVTAADAPQPVATA